MVLRNLPSILVYRLDDFSPSTIFHELPILASNGLRVKDESAVVTRTFTFSILQHLFFTPIVIFSAQFCAGIAVFQF